jgi:hypothetical protein
VRDQIGAKSSGSMHEEVHNHLMGSEYDSTPALIRKVAARSNPAEDSEFA